MKLATICYIDNGKEFLLLLRNKSQTMSMRANTLALLANSNRDSGRILPFQICEETGLTATKMKGIITFQNSPQDTTGIRMSFG